MKKFFVLLVFLFTLNVNAFAPVISYENYGDPFDQMMYEDHHNWWYWDRELRINIRRRSYWKPVFLY